MICRVCDRPVPKPARGPTGGFCGDRCHKKNANLKEKFGIDIETYRYLLAGQGGKCAICKNPCSSGRSLAVDHDHKAGAIRGLLCTRCNLLVGYARENPATLQAAIEYLARF